MTGLHGDSDAGMGVAKNSHEMKLAHRDCWLMDRFITYE